MSDLKSTSEGYRLKNIWLTVSGVVIVGFASISAVADNPASSAASLTADPIYQKQCAKCHGKSAEGRHFGGPALTTDKATTMSSDDLRNVIANGKGRMPKYGSKLSAEEINRLILELRGANAKTQ
jgi:mono/diheme cytochrome c family protein